MNLEAVFPNINFVNGTFRTAEECMGYHIDRLTFFAAKKAAPKKAAPAKPKGVKKVKAAAKPKVVKAKVTKPKAAGEGNILIMHIE